MATQTKLARVETAAKVLLIDTENSPNISFTWGVWEQNVIEVLKERQIFCFAWQWLHEKEVHSLALPDFGSYKKPKCILDPVDNSQLIKEIVKLYHKADIVGGHNLDGFDDKRINSEIVINEIVVPPPHKTVDTLKVARTYFDFNSNKLDDLARYLGVARKVEHWGFSLWRRCMEGDPEAWALMKKYNEGDIHALRGVYYKELPFMRRHPNVNTNNLCCPSCGGHHLTKNGDLITKHGRKPRFKCQDCGSWPSMKMVGGEWVC